MVIDRMQVKAGETVEVQALRERVPERYLSKSACEDPTGHSGRDVLDHDRGWKKDPGNSSIQYFVPRDLSELISTINMLKVSERLYVQTFRTTNGAIIGSSEMPNLPPSVLATLNNDRTVGGVKPAVQTIVNELKLPPRSSLSAVNRR
jgi:hypothetical protein